MFIYIDHTVNSYYSISAGYICGDHCLSYGDTCKCGQKDDFQGYKDNVHYCCTDKTLCKQDIDDNVECPQGQILDISKTCDQKCPSRSTGNFMAISSCNAEGCPDSRFYSTVCNVEPEKDFKDFCNEGKDCLMAKNANITYQQC